jgi:hypothetical protein
LFCTFSRGESVQPKNDPQRQPFLVGVITSSRLPGMHSSNLCVASPATQPAAAAMALQNRMIEQDRGHAGAISREKTPVIQSIIQAGPSTASIRPIYEQTMPTEFS